MNGDTMRAAGTRTILAAQPHGGRLGMFRSAAPGISALSACALLLSSCGGGGSASMSTLNLGLTDAPVSGVTKVWIQFTGVEVKPAGDNAIDFMFSPAKGLDLLSLQGGATATFLND